MEAAKKRGTTTFHLMGSCRMAPDSDPTAVVDDQLRVRGLESLRVVDASIMPTMPSANLNASVLMIAEKAADMIRGRAAARSGDIEGLNDGRARRRDHRAAGSGHPEGALRAGVHRPPLAPQTLLRLIEAIQDRDNDLEPALAQSRATDWPERLAPARACLEARRGSGRRRHRRPAGGAGCADQPIVAAYRAMRGYARACEQLYPMAAHLRPVSQFFLEASARHDQALARAARGDRSAARPMSA